MSAAEDLVSKTEGGKESQENHTTGPTKDPVKDKDGFSENPVTYQAAGGAENPVNDEVAGGTEKPVNDQAAGGAEKPVNDQAAGGAGAENPVNDHATGGAENPVSDQLEDAENIENYQAGGAERPVTDGTDVERNPTSAQVGIAGNMVNNLAGVAETPSEEHVAGGAENSVHNEAGGAENSVHNEAGASESGMNDEAGGVESPISNVVDAALSNQADATRNSKENAVETPVECKADRLPEEAQEILKSLASQWEDVIDANALQVFPLKGAMTNEVFQIKWPTSTGETSRKVIVRIYGEGVDVFFDRSHEIQTFEFMSKNGQGPRLLGRFTNGRVEEFIRARVI